MIMLLVLLSVVLEGFFSSMETALISCNKVRLHALAEKGDKKAKLICMLLGEIKEVMGTTLVGTNIFIVTGTSFATIFFVRIFGAAGTLISTLTMTIIMVIIGELIPKSMARKYPSKILYATIKPFYFTYRLLHPLSFIVNFISRWFTVLLGIKPKREDLFLSKDDLKLLVQEVADKGVLEEEEEETIKRIFEFTEIKIADVMINKQNISGIAYDEKRRDIIAKAKNTGFTRFPVIKQGKVIGVVNLFDLFYFEDEWKEHIRPVRIFHPNQLAYNVFFKMQINKESIAMVERKGKFIGLVSIDDIMKEIVLGD